MKIGFSILSHKKVDSVFKQLLQQLNAYPCKDIVIHHDFSQADLDVSSVEDTSIRVVEKSVRTAWSHANNIEAIMSTFEALYSSGCEWFVTLSANCYPIKNQKTFIDFLTQSTFDGYVECNNVNENKLDIYPHFRTAFNNKSIFSYPFIRRSGQFYMKPFRIARKPKEIILGNVIIPYHGSDWFMINRTCIEYILKNKKLVSDITQFLAEVNKDPVLNVCPPEIVFQTILANNKDLKLCQDNYRYIDWSGSIDWHPNVLKSIDFKAIQQSNAFFARKMEATVSVELIDRINSEILQKKS